MKENYENEFSRKNIIITGASSGVGLCSAFYFLNQNANVILACKDDASLGKICKDNNYMEQCKTIERIFVFDGRCLVVHYVSNIIMSPSVSSSSSSSTL